MTLLIASAEIVSAVFLVIILCGMHSKTVEKSASRSLFLIFVLMTILGLLSDAAGYIMGDSLANRAVLLTVNAMSFFMIDICIALYSFYLISRIREKKKVSYRSAVLVSLITAGDICWIFAGIVTGKLFRIEDNRMIYGPWRDYISIIPIVCVLLLLGILIVNSVHLERRHALALGTFIIFPLLAAGAVMIWSELELAYLAAGLSCEVIFIFIQHDEIMEARVREQIMERISLIDTLTGLKNRRGYEEAIGRAEGCSSIGVFFCDLNSLKYTNDNLGHAAGDAYIRRFAVILRSVFEDMGEICRISGDEFVVLLYDVSETKLDELKDKLTGVINRNDRIASVGCAYGEDKPVLELVTLAEQGMYDDKNRFYRETGRDRRRQ